MERSGRRETISTREKSLSARSRSVGRVRGKSIIVPRMKPRWSSDRTPHAVAGSALGEVGARASYHQWASWVRERVRCQMAAHYADTRADILFPVANRVNFREDAVDRWSASLAPVVALL